MAIAGTSYTPDMFDHSASENDAEHNLRQSRTKATATSEPVVPTSPSSQKPILKSIDPEERYLSDNQVAKRFGVARPTIWRWVKTNPGFPQPLQVSPGTTRWQLSDLIAFESTLKSKRSATK